MSAVAADTASRPATQTTNKDRTMSTVTTELSELPTVAKSRWRIDPARSSIEFRTPTLWGLATVKGRFDRYEGTFDLDQDPAIELTIDAGSLDTKNKLRDKHLRSADFFDVEHSPEVRFVSDGAMLDGQRLQVRGRLYAGGSTMPLELEAGVRPVGDELEVVSTTHVDHRELGMTHSTLGMIRMPSELIVRGRLVRDTEPYA
jgi:polyisoprenoid-binding protein YceI